MDFQEYEMQKKFDEHQKVESMDETQKKEYMDKVKKEEEAIKHHEPVSIRVLEWTLRIKHLVTQDVLRKRTDASVTYVSRGKLNVLTIM